MAEILDDGEFWLPSKFLADEETVIEEKDADESVKNLFLCGFPYEFGFSSDSSSPVESVIGSTETESDEDELLAELTRQIAFIGVDNKPNVDGTTKSGSPQSTLSPIRLGYQQGPTRVPSPFNWEFEVARTRMLQDAYQQQLILYQKLLALQQLKQRQQQILKKQNLKGHGGFYKKQLQRQNQGFVQSRGYGNPMDLSASAWPTLVQAQQQQRQKQQQRPGCGSGMHAVFIGGSGRKNECAGTGVFLPRLVGTQTESRKKTGSLSVILPAKVVKALNPDLGELGPRPQLYAPNHVARGFRTEKDVDFMARSGGSQQRPAQQSSFNQEYRLPQEWIY